MSSSVNFTGSVFRQRLFGAFAFILFAARLVELIYRGETAHILWVCHISNLLMALGILLGHAEFVRICVLWLILGAPLWPIDIIRTGIIEPTSIGTHYIGLAIGLLALRQLGMGKFSWFYAWIWFLLLQQLSRMFTPAEYNINLAHAIYPGWERFFSTYWQYWLFTTAAAAICLWLTSNILSWIFGKRNVSKHG